jgi:Ca-activated chloride channel homolog
MFAYPDCVGRTLLHVAFAVSAGATLNSQVFRSRADLVTVPVVVSGRTGDARSPLGTDDFQIFEDGVQQVVAVVEPPGQTVSVCLLLDSSGSMAGARRELAATAGQQVLKELLPHDEVAFVSFGTGTSLALPWTVAGTSPTLDWQGWRPGGDTALRDGVKFALGVLEAARHKRAAIVIISDGQDNASRMSLRDLAVTQRQSEALIHALQILPDFERAKRVVPPQGDQTDMRPLVTDSGGVVYRIDSLADASKAAVALVQELRSAYLLGYYSSRPPDGRFHRLAIRSRDRSLKLRYRTAHLSVRLP